MSEQRKTPPQVRPSTPTNFPPAVGLPPHLQAQVALARARERAGKVAGARQRMEVKRKREELIRANEERALRRKMGLRVPVAEVAEVRSVPALPPETIASGTAQQTLTVDEAIAALDALEHGESAQLAPRLVRPIQQFEALPRVGDDLDGEDD